MKRIADIIQSGGVVILPTETVYGIAARADDAAAIARIYDIKGRSFDKALAVCVSGVKQAQTLAAFNADAISLASAFWPGPLTLVLPAKTKSLHDKCYQGETIALRCPDIDWRAHFTETPLALTSANRSGEADALTAETDLTVDAVLDGGRAAGGIPSTILSVADNKITLLREGALGADKLAAYDIGLP